jgi:hypothetical protein
MGSREYELAYDLAHKELPLPERRVILLISQPLFEDKYLLGGMDAKYECIRDIVSSVNTQEGVHLAVKSHPRESVEWYQQHFEDEELFVYPRGTDLNQAILESRYVIGFFSTALVNALILRRPVGIIRWMGDHGYAPNFDKDGAAMALNKSSDLIEFIGGYDCSYDVSWYAYDSVVHSVLEETVNGLILGVE